jgi:putative Mg2+ transporter-C (MgtC) family protein
MVAGLTTSAAIWLTAGLGMAAGAGQYLLALLGLAFAMALLLLGGPFERLLQRLFRFGKRPPEQNGPDSEDPPG